MKKIALFSLICLLLFPLLAPTVRAETVMDGPYVEFTLTTFRGVNSEYLRDGDLLVQYRGEGFDTLKFRMENFYGYEPYRLVAEHEMAAPCEGSFGFPSEEYPLRDFLVTVEGTAGGESLSFSFDFSYGKEMRETASDDNVPPLLTVWPEDDRMRVTVSDAGMLFGFGDSLIRPEMMSLFGGCYTPEYRGTESASYTSDPIPFNGRWAYTAYATDMSGCMMARTVFLTAEGLGDMPDSVRYAPVEVPQTSPNTADRFPIICSAAAAGMIAAFLLRRRKRRA